MEWIEYYRGRRRRRTKRYLCMDRVFLLNLSLSGFFLTTLTLLLSHIMLDVYFIPTMKNFFQKDKEWLEGDARKHIFTSIQQQSSEEGKQMWETVWTGERERACVCVEWQKTSTEITRAIKYLIQSFVLALCTRMHIRAQIKTAKSSNYSLEFQCAANAASAAATAAIDAVANAFGMTFRASKQPSERASIWYYGISNIFIFIMTIPDPSQTFFHSAIFYSLLLTSLLVSLFFHSFKRNFSPSQCIFFYKIFGRYIIAATFFSPPSSSCKNEPDNKVRQMEKKNANE